jgi:hypothetical protein
VKSDPSLVQESLQDIQNDTTKCMDGPAPASPMHDSAPSHCTAQPAQQPPRTDWLCLFFLFSMCCALLCGAIVVERTLERVRRDVSSLAAMPGTDADRRAVLASWASAVGLHAHEFVYGTAAGPAAATSGPGGRSALATGAAVVGRAVVPSIARSMATPEAALATYVRRVIRLCLGLCQICFEAEVERFGQSLMLAGGETAGPPALASGDGTDS